MNNFYKRQIVLLLYNLLCVLIVEADEKNMELSNIPWPGIYLFGNKPLYIRLLGNT